MFYLIVGFVAGIIAFAATRRIVSTVITFFMITWSSYLVLPTLQFGFIGLPILLFLVAVIILIYDVFTSEEMLSWREERKIRWRGPSIILGVCVLLIIVAPIITTWSAFHASSYRNLIGEIRESTFSTDTAPVDVSRVRIVDQRLARVLGEKRLGEDPGLGSQVELGTLNIQQVRGELYWVGPLNHSGFFKWWANSEGTPGYIMVSATNERDVRLVKKINGNPIRLRHNNGNWFGDVPGRYVYANGYTTIGRTDFTFEIDDDGNPYWVITAYEKQVGYSGDDATGVILLNAQTGKITPYSIKKAPEWIDRIQPESIIVSQLDDWGAYVQGWLNSWTSKRDVLKTTPGMSLVYGENGKSYWYTGMSSVGSDESTVGFVLVNTRTKEARFYKQTGATETAAMTSAQGSVQEKGYYATNPILYNVGGVPTYFTTLKDKGGLVKLVAWVSVENYSIVGTGKTVGKALRAYKSALYSKGNAIVPDGAITQQKIEGVVSSIASEVSDGRTIYYLMIRGHENKLFSGTSDLSPEIIVTQAGHRVAVTFDDGGNEIVDISSFDNKAINLQKTKSQIAKTRRFKRAASQASERRSEQNAEADWEKLSPKEKSALMKKLNIK